MKNIFDEKNDISDIDEIDLYKMEKELIKTLKSAEKNKDLGELLAVLREYLKVNEVVRNNLKEEAKHYGIHNRTRIMKIFEREIQRAERNKENLSLIIFDVDNLKEINTHYGHEGGDRALEYLSNFLRKKIRQYDEIGFTGGDEIICILPETKISKGKKIAKRLAEEYRENSKKFLGFEVSVTYGVASNNNGDDKDEIYRRADKDLMSKKQKSVEK